MTPLWDMVSEGGLPNGVRRSPSPSTPVASGLVGDHTEGAEPTSGTFVTTSQTITPTAVSGKASLTREIWDMGGNPQVSNLVWRQMARTWRESLESATSTFLATLTAATDITLTTASADDVLAGEWDAAIAGLQFVRSYDFPAFAGEHPLQEVRRRVRLDRAEAVPDPRPRERQRHGLQPVPPDRPERRGRHPVLGDRRNSRRGELNWLFDPSVVYGWATAPQRLEFPGTDSSDGYAPIAMVDIGLFGYVESPMNQRKVVKLRQGPRLRQ